jgi:hypothetical protein
MLLEVLPHPSKSDQRIFPLAITTRAAEGAGDKPVITVSGTDGSEDRHGSMINPDGWDLLQFNRNPVVTWSHQDDTVPAIGRAPNPRRVGGAWDFDIEFAIDQWRDYGGGNLAQLVYRLMKDDYMRAVSVAFIPKKWEDRRAETVPTFFAENIRYLQQELTAISPCNVPSNRNGLKKALVDHVISENEARLLGIGAMFGLDAPYVMRTTTTEGRTMPSLTLELIEKIASGAALSADELSALTDDATSESLRAIHRDAVARAAAVAAGAAAASSEPPVITARAKIAALRVTIKNARTALRDYWYVDGPCGPFTVEVCPLCGTPGTIGCDCQEQVDAEDAADEQQSMIACLNAGQVMLGACLDGWATAEHDLLRDFYSSRVFSAMWDIDRLLDFADYWYPDAEIELDDLTAPDMNPDQIRKFTAAMLSDERLAARLSSAAMERMGAEFSAKNKKAIKDIHSHAMRAADSASQIASKCMDWLGSEPADDDPEEASRSRENHGPTPAGRAGDEGRSFRVVSAADSPGAGAGQRSTSEVRPSLYSRDALTVSRK